MIQLPRYGRSKVAQQFAVRLPPTKATNAFIPLGLMPWELRLHMINGGLG